MRTDGAIITNAGQDLIAFALLNNLEINFTTFKIGKGSLNSIDQGMNLTDLISFYKNTPIITKKQITTNEISLNTSFTNLDFLEEINLKELGLFANVEGREDILFAYINDGEGEIYPPGNSGNILERVIKVHIGISNDVKINIIADKSIIYITVQDFEQEKIKLHDLINKNKDAIKILKNKSPYRIGDILTTENKEHPALTWPGTSWDKIEATFLRGTEVGQEAGEIGGSNTVTLKIGNLPPHNHPVSVILENSGIHRHKVDNHIHASTDHFHFLFANTSVNPNKDGDATNLTTSTTFTPVRNMAYWSGGIDAETYASQHLSTTIPASVGKTSSSTSSIGGSSPNTNSQGEHGHTVTARSSNIGNGEVINILPKYYTVHYWKRIS